MLKLKQYLCSHREFHHIARHRSTSQNLWQCPKCKVFYIQHWGVGSGYYSKTPHIDGWIYKESK